MISNNNPLSTCWVTGFDYLSAFVSKEYVSRFFEFFEILKVINYCYIKFWISNIRPKLICYKYLLLLFKYFDRNIPIFFICKYVECKWLQIDMKSLDSKSGLAYFSFFAVGKKSARLLPYIYKHTCEFCSYVKFLIINITVSTISVCLKKNIPRFYFT